MKKIPVVIGVASALVLSTSASAALCGGAASAIADGGLLPDIVDAPPSHLNLINSHQEEILRFTTEHINIGAGPLQIRPEGVASGCTTADGTYYGQCTVATQEILDIDGNVLCTQNAGVSVFHPEHNHWHQDAVADFVLLEGGMDGVDVNAALQNGSLDSRTVASSLKTTYCLIDYDKTDLVQRNSERVYFDCNGATQGISVGWSDEYHHATHGQDLVLTGLAPGVYTLLYNADPLNHWIEIDEENNFSWTTILFSRDNGANPKIDVLASSPCVKGITCGSSANK